MKPSESIRIDINKLIDIYKDRIATLEAQNIQQQAQIIALSEYIDNQAEQDNKQEGKTLKGVTPTQVYERDEFPKGHPSV